MNAAEAIAEFEAQGTLQPGEEGWWKVWGARIHNVRSGDIMLCKDADTGEVVTEFIEEIRPAGGWAGMRLLYVAEGVNRSIGALAPIIVVRKGTHNTLA